MHSIRVWLHRYRSGRVIDVQMSCCDIELDARVVRMVQAQDISPRLRAEAVKEEQDRTLRKALYGIDEGLLVLGTDSKPVFVNAAAAQILGLPEPDLLTEDVPPSLHHMSDPTRCDDHANLVL